MVGNTRVCCCVAVSASFATFLEKFTPYSCGGTMADQSNRLVGVLAPCELSRGSDPFV